MLAVSALALTGCGIHLYDPAKEKVAADIKTRYAEVKLLDLIETEKKNLDALLVEELAAAREADRVILDLELLRIAEGREPIGLALAWTVEKDLVTNQDTRVPRGRAALRLRDLGWASVSDVRRALQDAVVPPEAESRSRLIYSATGRRPPPCDATDFDEALAALSRGIADKQVKTDVESDARRYAEACKDFKPAMPVGAAGEVGLAYQAWQAAKTRQAQQRARVAQLQQKVQEASQAHDAALKAVSAADTSETREQLKAAADALRKAVAALAGSDIVGGAGLPAERARALDVILGAIAGGEVDSKTLKDNPELARAAAVAGDLPSIAESIDGLVRRAKAPALGALVLEKEHQILLRDHAARLEQLESQRVQAQEARYRALVLESRFLLEQHDAVCRFSGARQTPAVNVGNCDGFAVTVTQDAAKRDVLSCRLVAGQQDLVGDQCPASAPWGTLWADGIPEARRHLYRAVIALVQRFTVARAQQDEAEYGLVNLLHQEVTATDEYAIRAWNSLIATPVNQLAAYHQSGIKPAELADLIVKAVGLGAIGVGVNR
jgi:hypothetical protein